MKISAIAIFLTIVLSVYGLTNWYIYSRTSPLLEGSSILKISIRILFWIIILAYPIARITERFINNDIIVFFVKIGSFWMGAMLYLFLIFFIVDIFRLINYSIPVIGILDYKSNPANKELIAKVVYVVTMVVLIVATINARNPRINHQSLIVNKQINEKLRIATVSDIHLGTLISHRSLKQLVNKLNEQNPDIVLFAGDVFDEDISHVINNGLGNYFTQIKAPLGVFAIPGNHEYFGGVEHKLQYLKDHGVQVLRDSTILINGKFYIIGRDDRSNTRRKSVSELIEGTNTSKTLILLDHQPFDLAQSAQNGIDLQISGHTHHGQLWPFNYITNAIYEVSSGYKKIGDTHVVVSNGFGTWGPPMRLGNRPEILVIDLVNNQ
ncbi:MAG: metallophosphoesterase [Bacteroidales bacterium]|jgi:predicted MPP superfamily phosphohydrolase|nr:metallophosphoesterase [Bacteroidales bacterium]